jgi:hypothetical protein
VEGGGNGGERLKINQDDGFDIPYYVVTSESALEPIYAASSSIPRSFIYGTLRR